MMASGASRQRLDKWLFHARIVKSRTLAQKLIESGAVRINSIRSSASDARVGAGDVLTIGLFGRVVVIRILGCAEWRGPAIEASGLYESVL